MPDGKKTLVDWSGFKPKDYSKPEQPKEESTSLLGLFGAAVGLMTPQINFVKDVVLPTLEEPGKQMNEGLSKLDDNPIAGGLKIAQSLGTLVSTPFTGLDQSLRHVGLSHTANTIAYPFEKISEGVKGGERILDDIIGSPEAQNNAIRLMVYGQTGNMGLAQSLTDEKLNETAKELSNFNQMSAQFLAPVAFAKGKNFLKANLPKKVSPVNIEPYAGEIFDQNTGGLSKEYYGKITEEAKLRDVIRKTRPIEQKLLPELTGNKDFVSDKYGNVYNKQEIRVLAEVNNKLAELEATKRYIEGEIAKDKTGENLNVNRSVIKDIDSEIKDIHQSLDDAGYNRPKGFYEPPKFETETPQPKTGIEERTNKNGKKYYYDNDKKTVTSKEKFEEQQKKVTQEPVKEAEKPIKEDVNDINVVNKPETPVEKVKEETPQPLKEEVKTTPKSKEYSRLGKPKNIIGGWKIYGTTGKYDIQGGGKTFNIIQQGYGQLGEFKSLAEAETILQKALTQKDYSVKDFVENKRYETKQPPAEPLKEEVKIETKVEKQPWEVTKEQLHEGVAPNVWKFPDGSIRMGYKGEAYHKSQIKQALEEGKKVPDEVLKDYPDLQKVEKPVEEFGRKPKVEETKIESTEYKSQIDLEKPTGNSTIDRLRKEARDALNNNPSFADPTVFIKSVQIGAEHFKNGLNNYAKWQEQMVKEFGNEIKPHLLKIWAQAKNLAKEVKPEDRQDFPKTDKTNLPPKEKFNANIQEAKFAKELQEFIRDERIPKEVQDAILREIKKNETKVTTNNIGFFRRKALDRGTNLTKKYGAAGGELYQRGLKGGDVQKQLLENAYNNFLNPLNELKEQSPRKFKSEITPEVIKALEDRVNADKYLTSPESKRAYELTKGLYDYFRGEMDKSGIKTIDDYFTHQLKVDAIDRILSDEIINKDPRDIKKGSVNDYYTANSQYTKERRADTMGLMNDNLLNVLNNYVHSMSRHLGYKEMIDFYKSGFLDEINNNPILKTNIDLSYVKDHLKGVLYPEIANSPAAKFITNRRNNLYQALLWNNFKAASQNLGQKFLTQFFTSPESRSIANRLYRNQSQITGRLAEAMAEVKRGDMAHYLDIAQQEARKVKGEKFDFFRTSEKGNWIYSELAGLIEATKRIDKSVKDINDVNRVLSDQKNFDKAVREARDLSSKTQYNPDVTFRPTAYDKWAVRTFAMFTRYPLGTTDLFAKTLIKSLDGAEGLRAQTILRRGLTDEAKPVEFLRATEYYRKSLENSIKEAKKEGYDFKGISAKQINQYINFLKQKEAQLNSILEKLEPMNKKKNAKIWGKYLGYSALVSFTYRMVQAQLWNAVGVTDNKKKTTGQHLTNVLMDVSPLPFYRFNPQEVINTPLIPNTEFILYGNWNLKGGLRSLLDYGLNTMPYTNILNQLLQRTTGETTGSMIFRKKSGSGMNLNLNIPSLPNL